MNERHPGGHRPDHRPEHKLDHIIELVRSVRERLNNMAFDLTQLTEKVTAIKNASDAAEALIKGLAQKLTDAMSGARDLAAAKAAIAEISSTLGTEAEELGAAITANTPAEEPPTP